MTIEQAEARLEELEIQWAESGAAGEPDSNIEDLEEYQQLMLVLEG